MEKIYIHPGTPPKIPPPVPANNVYRVKFVGVLEGQTTINVLYWADDRPEGNASQAFIHDLLDALEVNPGIVNDYVGATAETFTLQELVGEIVTDLSIAPVVHSIDQTGPNIGPALPNQMAVTLSKVTNWRGKQGRGRISMPAVPASLTAGSLVTNLLPWQTLALALKSPLVANTHAYRPGLYAPEKLYSNNQKTFESWIDLVNVIARPLLGTSRRRKQGVGI